MARSMADRPERAESNPAAFSIPWLLLSMAFFFISNFIIMKIVEETGLYAEAMGSLGSVIALLGIMLLAMGFLTAAPSRGLRRKEAAVGIFLVLLLVVYVKARELSQYGDVDKSSFLLMLGGMYIAALAGVLLAKPVLARK